MIKLRNVSISFGELNVLEDISFYVNDKEIVSIVGPSGCGKTTLLRCIAGIINPNEGEITINKNNKNKNQRQASFVFQQPVLLEWLTMRENIFLPFELAGNEYDKKFIDNLLQDFGLINFQDYFPRNISTGMAQRACLVRAIAEDSKTLLLDEPFSGLDEITRQNICTDFSKIFINRSTVFVTHTIHDAVFLGDRVLVLGNKKPTKIAGVVEVKIQRPREKNLWLSEKLTSYIKHVRKLMLE